MCLDFFMNKICKQQKASGIDIYDLEDMLVGSSRAELHSFSPPAILRKSSPVAL